MATEEVRSDAPTMNEEGISTKAVSVKCASCGKKSKRGCTKSLCLKCCSDESCQVHTEQREQALFREQVMSGTTPVQKEANAKRAKAVNKKGKTFKFRETGFSYLGDTVVVWNLSEYLDNKKWKEDALRKANKRRQQFHYASSNLPQEKKVYKGNRRKRFRSVMEDLYKKSLTSTVNMQN
eukprot:scaffold3359_cov123-Cylindrotheca_fusiformis.AAC.10